MKIWGLFLEHSRRKKTNKKNLEIGENDQKGSHKPKKRILETRGKFNSMKYRLRKTRTKKKHYGGSEDISMVCC